MRKINKTTKKPEKVQDEIHEYHYTTTAKKLRVLMYLMLPLYIYYLYYIARFGNSEPNAVQKFVLFLALYVYLGSTLIVQIYEYKLKTEISKRIGLGILCFVAPGLSVVGIAFPPRPGAGNIHFG